MTRWVLANHVVTSLFADKTTNHRRGARSGTPVRAKGLWDIIGVCEVVGSFQ